MTPCRGHARTFKTAAKLPQVGFFLASLFKDVHNYVCSCDCYQRTRTIYWKNEMPLNFILQVEIFDVWGNDLKEPFLSSRGNKYILISVDYVSK